MPLLPAIMPGEWDQVDDNFKKLTKFYIGPDATPQYTGLTLSGLTASKLIATDTDKVLTSAVESLSPTFTGLTLSGITQGSIFFAGASGVLSQDNTNLFWDDTNKRLGIGVNTGFDPRTGLTISGDIDILHTSSEADDHAFELDVDAAGYGDVKAIDIDYITGAIAKGEDEGIILINIDEIAAAGGDVFGVEVLATEGAAGSTTTVYGLKAGALIGPVHQNSGTFVNPAIGTNDTPQTPVANMIDGDSGPTKRTTIFVAVDDYIIIGATVAFQEIEFILTTPTSNPGIKPTFWYSTGGSGFTQFTPVDGTNGFRNTGVIAWDASDLTGHAVNADTGAANTYDIKIIRTKAGSLSPSPILGFAKIAATTEYVWDKDGDVNIRNLAISNGGTIGSVGDTDVMTIDASGNCTFSVFPITPSAEPDADYEVVNKKYVDDNAEGTDEKVKVDTGATEDYIGAANSDGVLRTGTSLSYTDGGNYVTVDAIQDIQTTASPEFLALNLTGAASLPGTVVVNKIVLLTTDDNLYIGRTT